MPLKKGSVEPDGTILCYGSGIRCISTLTDEGDDGGEEKTLPTFLDAYSSDSARYDKDLSDLANKLNSLMKETHEKRKNRELTLGLLMMDRGMLPVWKRQLDDDDDPSNYAAMEELVHLDGKTDEEIAQALGFDK